MSGRRGTRASPRVDNDWLHALQKATFTYFWQETNPENGLIPDNTLAATPASIAGVGLALATYGVGVDRGFVTRAQALERTLRTLRFFWNSAQGTDVDAIGYRGFYYHFLDVRTGRRAWRCKLSTIDTTVLLAGALTAAACFDRDTTLEREVRALRGEVQSLIGLEMQVDALRRSPRDVAQVIEGLARVQQHLANEIRGVRDLMHELEPTDFAPRRLLERLPELIDRFQRETGIAAQFVSEVEEVTLAPPVCHELARITREALVNVRKHSGAHNVVVRFISEAGCSKLIIDNDGRGLGFTGRLSQAELDRRRKGPVVIKERVCAMGADLAVESSERGVRLEVTLPPRTIVRHKTAQAVPSRRT